MSLGFLCANVIAKEVLWNNQLDWNALTDDHLDLYQSSNGLAFRCDNFAFAAVKHHFCDRIRTTSVRNYPLR